MTSKIDFVNDFFKLPISYNSNKVKLNDTIITDLELIKTIEEDSKEKDSKEKDSKEKDSKEKHMDSKDKDKDLTGCMYNYAFKPKTVFGKHVMKQIPQYYSTDSEFLKDSQSLLKTYKDKECDSKPDFTNILSIWDEIKLDTGFIDKYQFVDIDYFKHLNNSDYFLQIMSMYNLSSPVISLFVPLFLLVIPFFIIQLRGLQISISQYIEILQQIAANHALGQLFTNFNQVDNQQKIYLIMSAGFYLFSIYQNILTCLKFHNNMIKIHSYLDIYKNYIDYTCASMSNLLSYTSSLNTYSNFNNSIKTNMDILNEFNIQLKCIFPYKLTPYTIGGLGHVLKCFYFLYDNIIYNDALMYSFGFNGYIDNIEGLIENISGKFIQFNNFTKEEKKEGDSQKEEDSDRKRNCKEEDIDRQKEEDSDNKKEDSKGKRKDKKKGKRKDKKKGECLGRKLVNSYYPVLMHNNPVKNTCNLENMTITGPNASGKTTTLKSILINVIITQQFGCGFYEDANIKPYDFIHCYLNIPDTSGRDSLFQAECRRCKEILDCIKVNDSSKTHLCVFDELYSGTNPEEAVMSSLAFMKYLIQNKNITSVLTTHFVKVCHKLEKHHDHLITNYHMQTETLVDNDFKYTYKLEQGISSIKGGLKVLRDMNYPDEILNDTDVKDDE